MQAQKTGRRQAEEAAAQEAAHAKAKKNRGLFGRRWWVRRGQVTLR